MKSANVTRGKETPEENLVVEPPRISREMAASIAVKTYSRGWFRKSIDAVSQREELVYVPYWLGQGKLVLKSAFGEKSSCSLFACDGWKGDAGTVQGGLPQFSTLDGNTVEYVVTCRITAEQAADRIQRQSCRFASGRYLTAKVEDISLQLIHKPFWAVSVKTGEGRNLWRLVSADAGMVTYRFDPELELMLKDAGVEV